MESAAAGSCRASGERAARRRRARRRRAAPARRAPGRGAARSSLGGWRRTHGPYHRGRPFGTHMDFRRGAGFERRRRIDARGAPGRGAARSSLGGRRGAPGRRHPGRAFGAHMDCGCGTGLQRRRGIDARRVGRSRRTFLARSLALRSPLLLGRPFRARRGGTSLRGPRLGRSRTFRADSGRRRPVGCRPLIARHCRSCLAPGSGRLGPAARRGSCLAIGAAARRRDLIDTSCGRVA